MKVFGRSSIEVRNLMIDESLGFTNKSVHSKSLGYKINDSWNHFR